MAEKNLEKQVSRGERARQLLENSVLPEAFAAIKEVYTKALVEAPIRDIEGIQKLKIMIGLVDKLKETLETFVNDGKVAVKELSWLQKKAGKMLKVL